MAGIGCQSRGPANECSIHPPKHDEDPIPRRRPFYKMHAFHWHCVSAYRVRQPFGGAHRLNGCDREVRYTPVQHRCVADQEGAAGRV
jgi:hypothetical protein